MSNINSRIPYGRPSRIPGGSSSNSKLPHSSNRIKQKNKFLLQKQNTCEEDSAQENIKPNQCQNSKNCHSALSVSSDQYFVPENSMKKNVVDRSSSSEFSEESCDIVSYSSSNSSPTKQNNTFQERNNQNYSAKGNSLLSSKRFSAKESLDTRFYRSTESQKIGIKGVEKSSLFDRNIQLSDLEHSTTAMIESTDICTTAENVNLKSNQSLKIQFPTKNRIMLPPSQSRISAANAIDYVKKLTSKESLDLSRSGTKEKKLQSTYDSPKNITRTISSRQTSTNIVKSKEGLETSLNSKSRYKPGTEKSFGSRLDRKMFSSESKIKLSHERAAKNMVLRNYNVADVVHAFESQGTEPIHLFTLHRTKNPATPRIVRPVTRPPRRRGPTTDNVEGSDGGLFKNRLSSHINDSNSVCNGDADKSKGDLMKSDKSNFVNEISRDVAQFPVTVQQDDVHSEDIVDTSQDLLQTPLEEITNNRIPYGSSAMACDFAIGDGDQNNDRYKEILQNPDIVTFGQYRLLHEGNYSPEEKYGSSERKRIRSSTELDTNSTICNSSLLDGDSDVSDQNKNSIANKVEGKLVSSFSKSATNVECNVETQILDNILSDSDVPSLDSTVIADVPCSASISTPSKSDTTATSGTFLSNTLDELVEVREALEELQKHLEQEKIEKERLQKANERLAAKNSNLVDEVNSLTRIMEFQFSPLNKRINPNECRNRFMCDAETQTEEKKPWCGIACGKLEKVELAINHLNKVMEGNQAMNIAIGTAQTELNNFLQELT